MTSSRSSAAHRAAEHEVALGARRGRRSTRSGSPGVDAVVHLAGETIGQRWSAGARDADPRRAASTARGLLARTLAALDPRPAVARPGVGRRLLRARRRAGHGGEPEGCGVRRRRRRGVGGGGRAARDGGHPRRRAAPGADPRPATRGSASGGCACRSGSGSATGRQRARGGAGPLPDVVRVYLHALETDLTGSGERRRRLRHEPRVHEGARAGRCTGRHLPPPRRSPSRLAFGQMGEELLLGGQRPRRRAARAGGLRLPRHRPRAARWPPRSRRRAAGRAYWPGVPDEGGRRDDRDRFLPAAPRAARRLNSETGLSRRARRHAPLIP